VEVAVAAPVDQTFTYAVPPGLGLQLGHAVLVPFGKRRVTGYVVGPGLPDLPDERLLPVDRLLDPTPAFDATQLQLLQWAADYYLAGLGEVIATALPSRMKAKVRVALRPTDAGVDALALDRAPAGAAVAALREIVARPGLSPAALRRTLDGEWEEATVDRAAARLVQDGLVEREEDEGAGPGAAIREVRLVGRPDDLPPTAGLRMRGVVAALAQAGGRLDLPDLLAQQGPSARDAVRRLAALELVEEGAREDRSALDDDAPVAPDAPPPPNDQQQAALDAIAALGAGGVLLLHGVTGAGKTEVYLQAAARVLDSARQVLILVPEIALTPQLTARVRARFGARVAVLHSGLTDLARLREWRRIRAGEATVAVGARSALFAPFPDLGLIVVDEEHDDSYKQSEGVCYHARDLAVVRARMAGCPVVLGSATPSLETWANARAGRYQRAPLTRRATPRAVPQVELVDLRGRPPDEVLSVEVVQALKDVVGAGGQAIVLYNRRGYAPSVECPGCGAHFTCPSCGVRMVWHKGSARVLCHYCGLHRPFDRRCTICHTEMDTTGFGTERVADLIQAAFPGLGVARMDADTTAGRGAHARILQRFREGADQVLVGTQIVAKGHDFPNVQLAVIVGVDNILGLPDFRSAERTWSLATQLAGRAGRGSVAGRVLLQTRHPEHFVFTRMTDIETGDLDSFYEHEMAQRELLRYPPASRLVLLRVEGADRDATQARAGALVQALKAAARGTAVRVMGPVSAPLSRLVGRWRMQVLLRALGDPRELRGWLRAHRALLRAPPQQGVRVHIDVDPRHLL
jgi:primosomal protein N' (replication factor Y)